MILLLMVEVPDLLIFDIKSFNCCTSSTYRQCTIRIINALPCGIVRRKFQLESTEQLQIVFEADGTDLEDIEHDIFKVVGEQKQVLQVLVGGQQWQPNDVAVCMSV